MNVNPRLLALLADGQWHSGEAIGAALSLSRTAVWKQLKRLSGRGLSFESVRGRGYRLHQPVELLSDDSILDSLAGSVRSLVSQLDVRFDVVSTNDLALNATESGYVCFAEGQTAGRGRRGRSWVSPLACNLYGSVRWRYESGVAALEGLSLVVGMVVAQMLSAMGVGGVRLKWPNDILLQGAKLGGILLEVVGDPSGPCDVVIGVGINVHMLPGAVQIDQCWASVGQQLPHLSRNQLAAEWLNRLLPVLNRYEQQRFAHYHAAWSQWDAYLGADVTVSVGRQSLRGKVLGVDGGGALRLLVAGRERRLCGGELSLRPYDNS